MFVCAGNICRSPMAEAVFRHLVTEAGLAHRFEIASSGTGSWHVGSPPHQGTQAILQKHAISVGTKRAQQLTRDDLTTYDYVLAADDENMYDIRALHVSSPGEVRRLLELAPTATPEEGELEAGTEQALRHPSQDTGQCATIQNDTRISSQPGGDTQWLSPFETSSSLVFKNIFRLPAARLPTPIRRRCMPTLSMAGLCAP
jgi:protein-tyrosine phosphatase